MEVHLVDGTYELFRQFFGQRHRGGQEGQGAPAVAGVLGTVLTMIGEGATHLAVATDQRIESFRNALWPGYKTSEGVDPALLAQFPVLEEALAELGVLVLAMSDLEADDALASVAAVAAEDPEVERVLIWTPDKDLAQCVVGSRVVQVDRVKGRVVDEEAVVERFGVRPCSVPDWLALVGDSADGFPGLPGWGKKSASEVLGRYGHLEAVPAEASDFDPRLLARLRGASGLARTLRESMDLALLFRDLATLRVDRSLLTGPEATSWQGPTGTFGETARALGSPRLAERAAALASRL